jgi:hypothetical protein
MVFFGYYEQVPLGVIYHQFMAIGKTLTAVFADGEIKMFGKIYLKSL